MEFYLTDGKGRGKGENKSKRKKIQPKDKFPVNIKLQTQHNRGLKRKPSIKPN